MRTSIIDSPPSSLLRRVLRLPILLYHMRLGGLLGNRFLLLQHVGRKSGRRHETVIEVVKHDPASDAFYVVSGWGLKSDWYLNIQNNPLVTIWVGKRRIPVHTVHVPVDEAARVLDEYSRRYPLAFRELARLFLGERLQPGDEVGRRLADRLPMIAFQATQQGELHP